MHTNDLQPIWIEMIRNESLSPRWNHDLVLYWHMTGTAKLFLEKSEYELKPDMLLLIPQHRLFHLEMLQGQGLLYHISRRLISPLIDSDLEWRLAGITGELPGHQVSIRILLAKLSLSLSKQQRFNQLLVNSQLFSLLYELCAIPSCQSEVVVEPGELSLQNMERILQFIDDNYMKKLSLTEIGKKFYISPTYLSKLFKKNIGMTPGEYINTLRLNRAERMLRGPGNRMEDIAEVCGFSDVHALIRNFKQKYEQTPGQYRKNVSDARGMTELEKVDTAVLEKYWQLEYEPVISQTDTEQIQVQAPAISMKEGGSPSKGIKPKFIHVEHASMLLQANIQHLLKKVKNEIGIDYVTFHGLLDDVISIYTINPQTRRPALVFQNLDDILDFIVSIGLKPVIEFSYMPRQLATELRMPGAFENAIISMPKSMEDWNYLVGGIVTHLLSRYGIKQVESWLFCCWQIPDMQESYFSLGEDSAFFSLYLNSWQTVKALNPRLSFGIPNMTSVKLEEGEWFRRFLSFCREHQCMPDFMGCYFYGISKGKADDDFAAYRPLTMSMNVNALRDCIRQVKANAKEVGWNMPAFYLPLWNYTFSGNPLEDTTFRSVYIVKNVIENLEGADGYGCGILSDYSIYSRMDTNTYFGFHGLFTRNGIPKAAYNAYTLLSRLGSHLVARGDGWCVTKQGEEIRIGCYYYRHFSEQYANFASFTPSENDRYLPFAMDTMLKLTIPLTDLPYDCYQVTERIINRSSGSSFDQWLEMGALPLETTEAADYLRAVSTPRIKTRILTVQEGTLEIIVELEPLESRLIELRP